MLAFLVWPYLGWPKLTNPLRLWFFKNCKPSCEQAGAASARSQLYLGIGCFSMVRQSSYKSSWEVLVKVCVFLKGVMGSTWLFLCFSSQRTLKSKHKVGGKGLQFIKRGLGL